MLPADKASNFRVADFLLGESTNDQWISLTKD